MFSDSATSSTRSFTSRRTLCTPICGGIDQEESCVADENLEVSAESPSYGSNGFFQSPCCIVYPPTHSTPPIIPSFAPPTTSFVKKPTPLSGNSTITSPLLVYLDELKREAKEICADRAYIYPLTKFFSKLIRACPFIGQAKMIDFIEFIIHNRFPKLTKPGFQFLLEIIVGLANASDSEDIELIRDTVKTDGRPLGAILRRIVKSLIVEREAGRLFSLTLKH